MSDQAEPIRAEGVVEALANQLLHAEGEQTVRDMARHVGDEVHGVLKRHGMLMKTTAGAIGVGVLAAVNVLADTLEFARRSMDEDQERAEISAAIRTLFVDLAPSELGLAATPDPRAAGAEREAACKLVFLLGAYGGYYAGMGISARNRSGSNWVKDPSRAKLLTPDDATEVAKREGGKVVDPPALRAVDAAPGGGVEPISDDCLRVRIGELGNQIHNLGCENQNDDRLSDRLGELSRLAWEIARDAPVRVAEKCRMKSHDPARQHHQHRRG